MILASPLTGGGKLPCRALTTRQVNGERTFSKFHSALGRPQLGLSPCWKCLVVLSQSRLLLRHCYTITQEITTELMKWWCDGSCRFYIFASFQLRRFEDCSAVAPAEEPFSWCSLWSLEAAAAASLLWSVPTSCIDLTLKVPQFSSFCQFADNSVGGCSDRAVTLRACVMKSLRSQCQW